MKSIFFILILLVDIIRRKGKDENEKGEKHKAIFIKKETKIRDHQSSTCFNSLLIRFVK